MSSSVPERSARACLIAQGLYTARAHLGASGRSTRPKVYGGPGLQRSSLLATAPRDGRPSIVRAGGSRAARCVCSSHQTPAHPGGRARAACRPSRSSAHGLPQQPARASAHFTAKPNNNRQLCTTLATVRWRMILPPAPAFSERDALIGRCCRLFAWTWDLYADARRTSGAGRFGEAPFSGYLHVI
jgi:hypothetical protein